MVVRIGAVVAAALMLGATPVQKVFLGTTQIWANEVVVTLGNTTNVVLKSLFTSEQWNDPYLKKRVVVPAGVEIGATTGSYAILATVQADGQAGSWAGDLTLEVFGTVSGIGGAPNSGVGGNAVRANFPGKSGQKLKVVNAGTLRAGGGGGGRAGDGGQGYYQTPYTARDPSSGEHYVTGGANAKYWSYRPDYTDSLIYWDTGSDVLTSQVGLPSYIDHGGYRYWRGSLQADNTYAIFRTWTAYTTTYTNGGVAGNGGRGQGYDGAATAGAAAVAGGTNAGASGKSGDGGGWGATGQAGANGASGNYTAGTAGASGGLAGFYLDGSANVDLTNTGTVLGRLQ